MLTTLSILSLDQGKIWKDPCPLPREDVILDPKEAPELDKSRWPSSAMLGLVARLLGSVRLAVQASLVLPHRR